MRVCVCVHVSSPMWPLAAAWHSPAPHASSTLYPGPLSRCFSTSPALGSQHTNGTAAAQPGQKITLLPMPSPSSSTPAPAAHKPPVASKPTAAPAAAAAPPPAKTPVKVVPFVQLDLNPDLGDELGEFVSGSDSGGSDSD